MFITGRSIRFIHNNSDGSSVNEPLLQSPSKTKQKDFLCYLNKDVRETAFLEGAAVKWRWQPNLISYILKDVYFCLLSRFAIKVGKLFINFKIARIIYGWRTISRYFSRWEYFDYEEILGAALTVWSKSHFV